MMAQNIFRLPIVFSHASEDLNSTLTYLPYAYNPISDCSESSASPHGTWYEEK